MSKKTEKKVPKQLTNFCWTLNNYTLEEELDLMCTSLPVLYICWGYEIAPTTETPHLQGYCELSHPTRLATIKKLGCGFERMHIEARKGTQQEAIAYTMGYNLDVDGGIDLGIDKGIKKGIKPKNELWFEWGTKKINKAGQRRDLDDTRECARDMGMREVAQWANFQQIRVAEKYLTYCEPKRTTKPIVTWLYGKTGTGKSRMANQMFPDAYTKSEGSKWWDGYDRHKNVILDDFRGNWMTFNELLTLIDRYERRVEFKGGCRQFVAENIVITCCVHPKDIYNVENERVDQLLRRIDFIEQLGEVDHREL